MNFQTQAVSQSIQQHQQAPPPVVKPEVAKEKAPLPEEYIYLQTVLEELKSQCLNVAQDAVSSLIQYVRESITNFRVPRVMLSRTNAVQLHFLSQHSAAR